MALLLALFSSIVWGTSDFLAGRMSRNFPPVAVLGGSQVFGLILALGFAITTGHWDLSDATAIKWGIGAGLLGLFGLMAFYSALATGLMGIVSPISSIGVIIPLAIGLIRGDQPTGIQYIGILIAITGVVLASGPELSNKTSSKPVILALIAAATFGSCVFCMAQGGRAGNPAMTIATMRMCQVSILVISAIVLRNIGGLKRQNIPMLIAIGVTDASANILFAFAAADGLLSIISVLGSLFPVMTVFLAWAILKERLMPIQYVGAACTILGVVAITAG
ncbi:MAG: DMT family transporter [Actinomycetales bacterium]|nr:DMT family transporter [Actinomycetales bacterium]